MFVNWKPAKVFYGWWIVGAAFITALYVGGVIFYGFTAIFEPIANDMGWSYAQVSLAASLRGLELGILAPVTGILTDRLGPRRLIFSGAVVTALGLFMLSRTTSLATFYGAFALIAIGMSATTLTVLMTAIANWFRLKIGIASGIAMSGFGFSGLMIPLIVRLIEVYDWRMTMIILAAGMLLIVMPLSFVFRHRPERYGYFPDGRKEVPAAQGINTTQPPTREFSMQAGQAFKTGTFWRMAFTFMIHALLVSTVTTHVMPYLSSIGISRSRASFVAMILPIMSVGGRLSFGWLGDRYGRRRTVAAAFAMMTAGMLLFNYASAIGLWLLFPFILLFGIGYGGSTATRPSMVAEYFGRANYGTILGLIVGINAAGAFIGPPIAGWVFDTWGSYQGVWLTYSGLAIAGSVLIANITRADMTRADNRTG
jgi:MFS family permease